MEGSTWPENSPNKRKMAIQELIRSREFAKQLQVYGQDPMGDSRSMSIQVLTDKLKQSIKAALSFLGPGDGGGYHENSATTPLKLLYPVDEKNICSADVVKTPVAEDRKGAHKRRRTKETRTQVSPRLHNDGRACRKFGEKEILAAKSQRSYNTCTHSTNQGSKVTKEVQRKEDNISTYLIACEEPRACSLQVNLDCHPKPFTLDLKDFMEGQQNNRFSSITSIEQESYSKKPNDLINNQMPTLEPLISQDQTISYLPTFDSHEDTMMFPYVSTFESHEPVMTSLDLRTYESYEPMMMSPMFWPDFEDGTSCAYSSSGPHMADMDAMVNSFPEDMLNFEGGSLF